MTQDASERRAATVCGTDDNGVYWSAGCEVRPLDLSSPSSVCGFAEALCAEAKAALSKELTPEGLDSLYSTLASLRREIHANPEPGFEEKNTQALQSSGGLQKLVALLKGEKARGEPKHENSPLTLPGPTWATQRWVVGLCVLARPKWGTVNTKNVDVPGRSRRAGSWPRSAPPSSRRKPRLPARRCARASR